MYDNQFTNQISIGMDIEIPKLVEYVHILWGSLEKAMIYSYLLMQGQINTNIALHVS